MFLAPLSSSFRLCPPLYTPLLPRSGPLQAERLWYLLCVALLNPFAANVDFLAFCLLVVRFLFLLLLLLPSPSTPSLPPLPLAPVSRLDRNVGNFICGFV